MRTLSKNELYNILYGCAVLGTGGGGLLTNGLALVDKALAAGMSFNLVTFEELPDDGFIGVPYCCGALSDNADETLAKLPVLPDPPGVLAAQAMERYLGRSFDGFMSTELGGSNTAEAFYTAAVMGRPIVDADPAGRSVPELQHSTFFLHDIPIAPMSVADVYGNSAVFDRVTNDKRAEAWARALATASNNTVGILDHPSKVADMRGAVIEGAITHAEKLGAALRGALESGGSPVDAVIAAGQGKELFYGTVQSAKFESREGFTFGTVLMQGLKDFAGKTYKIWIKNENIVSWLNDAVHVTAPDLICMLRDDGEIQMNPHVKAGQTFTVFALPAPDQWTTPKGIACLGPRSFGFDFDYKPF